MKTTLSLVIPCYNEQANLNALHRQLTDAAQAIIKQVAEIKRYEIILVDDGSRDATWSGIKELAEKDRQVTALKLSRNFGHQAALAAGLHACTGDIIAILDADMQDPPSHLLPMLQLMQKEQADMVYGKRLSREGESKFKQRTAASFYRVMNYFSDIAIPTDTGDFRIMRRAVLDVVLQMPEAHLFLRGMFSWAGFKQVAYPYHRPVREHGVSGYNIPRMLRLATDGITSFSIKPLRIGFAMGFFMALLSVILLSYVLLSWLFGDVVSGWTSVVAILLFFLGIQCVLLGVMGEYLGRIYMEVKRRPLYVIAETIGSKKQW